MKDAQYQVQDNGDFSIKNFRTARPFSSFFPGIAGLNGIPLWVFYTNRGQCISSFGIDNKDHAMLEFFPANRSYQLTSLLGFRTFLKIKPASKIDNGDNMIFWEPFKDTLTIQPEHEMIFSPEKLTLTEKHPSLSVSVKINYYTVPEEPFAGLIREVEIINSGTDQLEIEILDGLPWVNAYGKNIWVQKNMSRTGEAWVQVKHFEKNTPLFKLKVVIQDKPEVDEINSGHFAVYTHQQKILPMIIDPEAVFGANTNLEIPSCFGGSSHFSLPTYQTSENYTPCAFSYQHIHLPAESTHVFEGVFGHVFQEKELPRCVELICQKGWHQKKKVTNAKIMQSIQNPGQIFSANPVFDHYAKSTYLDNLLRGGTPVTFTDDNGKPHVLHVYSRKHGDLERDYNHFSIQPTFFSQGNGNYRDVNQNRRCDLWFNPSVKEQNIKVFLNMLQLDGHNPLVLKGSRFSLPDNPKLKSTLPKIQSVLKKYIHAKPHQSLVADKIKHAFTPGDLATFIEHRSIPLKGSFTQLFASLLTYAEREEVSDLVEGYWSDHWTYNLDLIENYLSVYPENKDALLFKDKSYHYFKSPAIINPRSKRYIIRNDKPFQTHNIEEDHAEKSALVRTQYGKGKVYKVNLISKLLCLCVNKIATLDPSGIGIEMEGGRPNWYDALNGLPGIFGSSTHETFELKRLMRFILDTLLDMPSESIFVPLELNHFFVQIKKLLALHAHSKFKNAFAYWDKSNTLKEKYRLETHRGVLGDETQLSQKTVVEFLNLALQKLNHGLGQCIHPQHKLPISYYYQEMIRYKVRKIKGTTVIEPLAFKAFPLPLFLEGTVHGLKTESSSVAQLCQAVKVSNLYDTQLKMFKVCESLERMPKSIGRCTVFSRGWLENESIWMHMEYKYLLEILRSGLYEEFFQSIQTAFVPFMNPKTYGRSILENSSFIASSANPNPGTHGVGYVARLSGSTIELLHMLSIMQLGKAPFKLDSAGHLTFEPSPILTKGFFNPESTVAEWLYHGERQIKTLPAHHFAFILFNTTLVCYENTSRMDTFTKDIRPLKYRVHMDDDTVTVIESHWLPEEYAVKLRKQKIKSLEIQLDKTYSTKKSK